MNENQQPSPYKMEGRLPMKQAIPLGLQHVLAMFVGNLTPILIICGGAGLMSDHNLMVVLIQNAMLIAGLVTLIQIFTIGPVGGRVPIIMGTSSGFIGVMKSVTDVMGGGILAYGAIMGASIVGGIFEGFLGFCLKPLRKFFPPIVTGTVVLSIGLSLIAVGVKSFGGGAVAKDYGSIENLSVGLFVMAVIVLCQHWGKGMIRSSAILIGIIAGYALCAIMATQLPLTAMTADGVEFTKAWVIHWENIAKADWISMPTLMPVDIVFDSRAIIPVVIMFIVTAVETVGDISGVMTGGLDREATDKELAGGVSCDGFGSALAALFGVLPNTSFSQNVGLVAMTKIVNLTVFAAGAIILILCGLFPKLAALISIMPQSVLGGAAVIMFSSIVISGIQLVTREPLSTRNISILAISLGLGFGVGSNMDILNQLPAAVKLIFGGSGIVPAALISLLMNILLPKEKTNN